MCCSSSNGLSIEISMPTLEISITIQMRTNNIFEKGDLVFSPNSTFISQKHPHLPDYIVLISEPNPLEGTLLSSADFGGVAK